MEIAGYTLKYVSADECYTAARGPYPTGTSDHYRHALYARAGFFAECLESFGKTSPPSWEAPPSWEEFSEEAESARYEYECGGIPEADDDVWILESIEAMSEDRYLGGPPEEEYAAVIADTESEVIRLWPQIEAVADALSTSRRLTGDEVARIIAETSAGEES